MMRFEYLEPDRGCEMSNNETTLNKVQFSSLLLAANRDIVLAEAYLRSAVMGLQHIHDLGHSDKSVEIADLSKALKLFTEEQFKEEGS